MNSKKILYYASILVLGIILGVITASWSNKSPNSVPAEAVRQEEFRREHELFALENQTYDFLRALNSGKIDYKKELSRLVKYGFDYGTIDEAKLKLLLGKWGSLSPRIALSAIEEIPFKYRYPSIHYVADGWAKRNPEELAYYYKDNKTALQQKHLLEIAMGHWADTAPEEAVKFLSSLEWEEEKSGLIVILEKIHTDYPQRYKEIVSLLPERQLENPEFLTSLMQQWTKHDPKAAVEWMSTRPNAQQEILAPFKELEILPALDSLANLVEDDPEALVAQVGKYPRWFQPEAWSMALNEVTDRKGKIEAVRWKEAHIPDELMAEINALESFRRPSSMKDENPNVYEELMTQMPGRGDMPEDLFSNVYGSYIENFSPRNPQETFSFLLKLNGDSSYILPEKELSNWLYDEPQKAQEWIGNFPFSEEDRKRSLEYQERVKPIMAIKKR